MGKSKRCNNDMFKSFPVFKIHFEHLLKKILLLVMEFASGDAIFGGDLEKKSHSQNGDPQIKNLHYNGILLTNKL